MNGTTCIYFYPDDVANFGEYEIDDDWIEGGQLDLSFVHDIPVPLDREDEQTKVRTLNIFNLTELFFLLG